MLVVRLILEVFVGALAIALEAFSCCDPVESVE